MNNGVFTSVAEVLSKQLGIVIESILPDSHISALGADSLDILEIVMALEQTFNIEIADNEYFGKYTVLEIVALCESKI